MATNNTIDYAAIAQILGGGQPQQQSTMNKVLNSKALELGVGMVGAGLQARSAGKRADQDAAFQQQQLGQNAEQFRVSTALKMLQDEQGRRDAAAGNIAGLTKLGDEEGFASRQAFASEMLPQLRNFSITPGDPAVAAAMPRINGGFSLPGGGLSAQSLEAFGPQATANALQRRQGQLDALNPQATEGDQNLMDVITMALEEDAAGGNRMAAEDGTMPNPDGTPPDGYEFDKKTGQLKKKGSSIWKKIGKAAIIAGGAGLMATGVGGPAGAALIGAGMGAGTGAIDGGWKGAALGGALGAATGGLGGGGASSIKSAIINPRTLTSIGSQFVPGRAGQIAQLGSNFLPGGTSPLRRDVNVINKRMNQLGSR